MNSNKYKILIVGLLVVLTSCKTKSKNIDSAPKGYISGEDDVRASTTSKVCWKSSDARYDAAKNNIQREVTREFARAGLTISGWQACGSAVADIELEFAEQRWSRSHGFGKNSRLLTLGDNHPCMVNFLSPESNCVGSVALHEFGHALGLHHEMNRRDNPRCQQNQVGGLGEPDAIHIGDFDDESVMNYCNIFSNNKTNTLLPLSAGDINTLKVLFTGLIVRPVGEPDAIGHIKDLSMTLTGRGISKAKYKVGIMGQIDCKSEEGYRMFEDLGQKFNYSIIRQSYPHEPMGSESFVICLLGGNDASQWQDLATYTAVYFMEGFPPPKIKTLTAISSASDGNPRFKLTTLPSASPIEDVYLEQPGISGYEFEIIPNGPNEYILQGVKEHFFADHYGYDAIKVSFRAMAIGAFGLREHSLSVDYTIGSSGFYEHNEYKTQIARISFPKPIQKNDIYDYNKMENFLGYHFNFDTSDQSLLLLSAAKDFGATVTTCQQGPHSVICSCPDGSLFNDCHKFVVAKVGTDGLVSRTKGDLLSYGQKLILMSFDAKQFVVVDPKTDDIILADSPCLPNTTPAECASAGLWTFKNHDNPSDTGKVQSYEGPKLQLVNAYRSNKAIGIDAGKIVLGDISSDSNKLLVKKVHMFDFEKSRLSRQADTSVACNLVQTRSRGPMVCPPGYDTLFNYGVQSAAECSNAGGRCDRCIGQGEPQAQVGYPNWYGNQIWRFQGDLRVTLPSPMNSACSSGGTAVALRQKEGICGTYLRKPRQNNSHEGVIEQVAGNLWWRNESNIRWRLGYDQTQGILKTFEDNPSKNSDNPHFALRYEKNSYGQVDIKGFVFLNEFYERTLQTNCKGG